jgi:hypothetical protein
MVWAHRWYGDEGLECLGNLSRIGYDIRHGHCCPQFDLRPSKPPASSHPPVSRSTLRSAEMAWTQLALAVRESRTMAVGEYETEMERFEELGRLEHVHSTLHGLYLVAQRIKPAVDSTHEPWRAEAEVRVRGYLRDVIGKRIDHHRAGTPLVKQATGVQVSEDVQDALHLNFLYEAMQQQRQVPLAKYGLSSHHTTSDKATQTEKPLPPLPSTDVPSEVDSTETPPMTPTPGSRNRRRVRSMVRRIESSEVGPSRDESGDGLEVNVD